RLVGRVAIGVAAAREDLGEAATVDAGRFAEPAHIHARIRGTVLAELAVGRRRRSRRGRRRGRRGGRSRGGRRLRRGCRRRRRGGRGGRRRGRRRAAAAEAVNVGAGSDSRTVGVRLGRTGLQRPRGPVLVLVEPAERFDVGIGGSLLVGLTDPLGGTGVSV